MEVQQDAAGCLRVSLNPPFHHPHGGWGLKARPEPVSHGGPHDGLVGYGGLQPGASWGIPGADHVGHLPGQGHNDGSCPCWEVVASSGGVFNLQAF